MPYAKLVDCTNMVTRAGDDAMMQFAARIRAYATVLQGEPLQICKTVAEARAWPAQQQLPR